MKKPLYSEIIDSLRQSIDNGDFSYDVPIATEKVLSEQFGVSIITARRALDELTREGLLWKKRGCGCFVKKVGGSDINSTDIFVNGPGKLISLIVRMDSPQNGGTLDIIKGCTECLTENGYIPNIADSSKFNHNESYFEQLSAKDNMSGIIHVLLDEEYSYGNIVDMYNGGIPSVTIDKHASFNIPSVLSDNFNGGLMAAKHLFELGHKNIAFYSVGTFNASETVRDRYMGYCKAHIDAGVKINKELCLFGGQDIYGNKIFNTEYNNCTELAHELDFFSEQVKYLVKHGASAVQVSNDHVAVRLIKAAIKNGIRVPEDLSVIGFDDSEIGHCSEVPLTTIKQDFFTIGYRAAKVLCGIIKGKKAKITESIPVELIIRESTAHAPL